MALLLSMDQDEFEAMIEGDYEEGRWEFSFTAIGPYFGGTGYDHHIKLNPRFVEEAERSIDEFSEKLRGMISLVTDICRPKLSFSKPALETDWFVHLGHSADRNYAGYANIYRGIKSIAKYSENTWFLMWDEDSRFTDEYRIVDGVLRFCRHEHPSVDNCEEFLISLTIDKTWRDSIVKREILTSLVDITCSRVEPQKEALDEANEVLNWCESYSSDVPSVLYYRAMYYRALGKEKACLSILSQFEDVSTVAFDLSLSLLGEDDFTAAKVKLRNVLQIKPDRFVAKWLFHMLDNSLLPSPIIICSRTFDDADVVLKLGFFPKLMEYLYGYDVSHFSSIWLKLAEYFRIKICHQIQTSFAFQNAEICYENAIEADPENGEILFKYALFRKQNNAVEQQISLLKRSAALGWVEAFSDLATSFFQKNEFAKAKHYFAKWEVAQGGKPLTGYGSALTPHYFLQSCIELGHVELSKPDKDMSKARLFFTEALRIQNQYTLQSEGVFNGLASLAFFEAEHETALSYANQMIEQLNSEYGWSMKASALNNLGRYKEALGACDEAKLRNDEYWYHYYVKACILARQNDVAGSVKNLEKAWYCDSKKVTEYVKTEDDFNAIKTEPLFVSCLKGM